MIIRGIVYPKRKKNKFLKSVLINELYIDINLFCLANI